MRFTQLLEAAGLAVKQGRGEAEIGGIAFDSRRAEPGCCFVAVRGSAADGHRFIAQALAAGSTAVVVEDASFVPDGVACAVVENTRRALGQLAQAFFDRPAAKLKTIAVTGTNGKTTVAMLIQRILRAQGVRAGLFGTIQYDTQRRCIPAGTTTPDPVMLAELAAEAVSAGATHLVMEASSHALDQDRMAGIDFQVGVFTNLSGDHLDYHQTMQRYLAAKRKLFENLSSQAKAVLNRDDPAGETLAGGTRADLLWYGMDAPADLWGEIHRLDVGGAEFSLVEGTQRHTVSTELIGRHNVMNCLAAAAACRALGLSLQEVAAGLRGAGGIPGRLQRVESDQPFQVFVDYAHTDDALANVLRALRPLVAGRLIVVFGCGGDRDRTKRPRMGRVAEELADRLVITSDNPRSEDPAAIIAEILGGLSEVGKSRAQVQADRRAAIALAVEGAGPGDLILIAGKGHEDYQLIGSRKVHFDDVEVAGQLLRCRGTAR